MLGKWIAKMFGSVCPRLIFERIDIAWPGDVVVLTLRKGTRLDIKDAECAAAHLRTSAPGVAILIVDGESFDAEVRTPDAVTGADVPPAASPPPAPVSS